MEYINIFIKSAFIDNMIFTFFFGMCSYLAVSKTVKTAVGLGAAVIFVLLVTIPLNYLLETYVLAEGALVWLGDEYATMEGQCKVFQHRKILCSQGFAKNT